MCLQMSVHNKEGDSMTKRENLLAMLRGEPFEEVPVEFSLCPALEEMYREKTGGTVSYPEYFGMPWRNIGDIKILVDTSKYVPYHPNLKEGGTIDLWGVAHEPGSREAMHMTYMRCPLKNAETIEELEAYPYPDFSVGDASHQEREVEEIHAQGLAAVGNMQCTVWETSWYLRGMENLMADMMCDPEMAAYVLDKVTEQSIIRAQSFAKAGADILYLGDDIGMQHTPMMSMELYREWLFPRLKKVIDAARAVKPDIVVFYHSCGFVTPFIPSLIEAGVDVLNPIQSECMDFKEIYEQYGQQIAFHGTIGTQTTMPFASPEEVIRTVHQNLDIAVQGKGKGLMVAPTHLLEPEVPWENILAYVEACRSYRPKF